MAFRDRLLATIRAARPVLETQGVLIVGSEVPNLLEPSADEPSVWTPRTPDGMPDPRARRADVAALLRRLEAGDPDLP